jgi:uncharacterized protein (DUF1499 family)
MIILGIVLVLAGVRPAMLAWAACALGVLCGLAVAVAIFVTGQSHLWPFAIIAAAPVAIAVPMVIKDLSYPRINDITTNVENPPAFVAALRARPNAGRDMAYPEHFGPIARRAYPNVRPLLLDEPPEQVFHRAERLAKSQSGWAISHRDTEMRFLEAEATTPLHRFVDDVVIQVSDEDGKARVDMRSKSREGLVDAGKNAQRIESFLGELASQTRRGE